MTTTLTQKSTISKSSSNRKDKVKVTVIFRGREITLTQQGRSLLEKIVQETEEIASVEQHPKIEGRTMVMVLAPKPV